MVIAKQIARGKRSELILEHLGGEPPSEPPDLPYGPDEEGHEEARPQVRLNNALVGMMLFLGADFMFFVALLGAFFVFRFGSADWPPLGQPRLPLAVTGVNTIILLASGLTMFRAMQTIRAGKTSAFAKLLLLTTALGTAFLLTVVVISILMYSLLPDMTLLVRIVSRLALLPVVAGVAYEFLRFTAVRQSNPLIRLITKPNLALQRLTTREPDEGMLAVAIAAFEQVVEFERKS
ncbi:DUF1385 domain-containing protein [candidate division KSB1 bacterium]|nr:DUF1385 domain-containing protein [candidate division KSB1 bacterium]